jgi:aminotransferase
MAHRVAAMCESDIRRYSAIVQEMGGVNLSQGVCDQPAPAAVKHAAKDAIDADRAIYTHLRGTLELRRAIAEKLRRFNRIEADPQREIVVTVGSAGAFACIMLATLNPGDEVILFSPVYTYYPDALKLIDATARFVDTRPPDWKYASDDFEAAFTDRTRMVVINTPCNPSGKVFRERELQEIAALARQHDCWILTDEIYEYMTYGVPHVSIASLPGLKDRTFTVSGPSKTYAVTGWRVGYAVGPADVMEKVGIVNDLLNICAPTPLQHGTLAGLALPDSYYQEMADDYRRRRDLLADTLADIGFTPFVPDGAFYLLAEFERGRFASATDAAETILHRVGVATVPAPGFYRDPNDGARQLRFCFAKQMHELEDACRRLRRLPELGL